MIYPLRYGADSSLRLELSPQAVLAHCDVPRGDPLVNVREAVERALAEPLSFPPLAQAALPGDEVVLALCDLVPGAATIVARVVDTLVANGVAARDITILAASDPLKSDAPDPRDELPAEVRRTVVFSIHDPATRDSLGYLAATPDALPIYVNRAIHDADLVISIGAVRPVESVGNDVCHAGLFPTFSDTQTLDRYRAAVSSKPAERARLRRAAEHAAWLLGVQFTVQVVPGMNGDVLHVLAGESQAVWREGARLYEAAWSAAVPGRAGLVVATLGGNRFQQTWTNVARAVAAASQLVSDEGAIAICSELDEPPGPALAHFADSRDADEAMHDLGPHPSAEAQCAAELLLASERNKIYLISRLNDEQIEELGILPIHADQLSRLAGRYDSCILLANAQHAIATTATPPQSELSRAKRKSRK